MYLKHSLCSLLLAAIPATCFAQSTDTEPTEATLAKKETGYRGIWFTLGQYTDAPEAYVAGKGYWDYGDKYSGGLGTYTAKHVRSPSMHPR